MIYVFKRNKKTRRKTIIKRVETQEEARELCIPHNTYKPLSNFWLEWTTDKDYLSDAGNK